MRSFSKVVLFHDICRNKSYFSRAAKEDKAPWEKELNDCCKLRNVARKSYIRK